MWLSAKSPRATRDGQAGQRPPAAQEKALQVPDWGYGARGDPGNKPEQICWALCGAYYG